MTLSTDLQARGLTVIVGPDDATDDELIGLQTINVDVPARRWGGKQELVLPAIQITPYYWFWWLRWCRTFTIRGTLRCPDGSPVPGAVVCAYDVDAWWWWWSRQQVGCATTDANGSFTMRFRWCCGWWPWWWWRLPRVGDRTDTGEGNRDRAAARAALPEHSASRSASRPARLPDAARRDRLAARRT